MPLNSTVISRIDTMVTSAVTGADLTLFQALGARLKPMRDTIAPVTIGGMSRSIQPAPARCTTTPTRSRAVPADTTPPWARAALWASMAPPPPATYPVTAPMGAMSAKELPR